MHVGDRARAGVATMRSAGSAPTSTSSRRRIARISSVRKLAILTLQQSTVGRPSVRKNVVIDRTGS